MTPVQPPVIRAVGTALPPHHVDQERLIAALRAHWGTVHYNVDRLEQLHRAVRVEGRYLALPLAAYPALDSFRKRNDAWIAGAVDLGAAAIEAALAGAGCGPDAVDQLIFVSTTGIATPSIDARLVNRLALRADIKRTPMFGLGCAAGVAGVARAADYLRGFPGHAALVVSVELCSLTLQPDDLSIANIISSGLFGDGAAAVLMTGGARSLPPPAGALRPVVVASRAFFYPHTERVMGWDVIDSGFKVVLSASVPDVVERHVGGNVDGFLADHGLERRAIRHWIAHTGGPRVLEAFAQALGLEDAALARSWRSLAEMGNLSSASVLFVLGDHLESAGAQPGEHGLMIAMGPGFCAEMVLLRW